MGYGDRRRLEEGVARSARVASAASAFGREAGEESCEGVCGLCRASCCCDRDCRAVGDCCGNF